MICLFDSLVLCACAGNELEEMHELNNLVLLLDGDAVRRGHLELLEQVG